ncbi:MAG: hypothetical protein J3K34DRAFT_251155 [Monoraphidium minutum]|nr:MAG: hypothetical protein J3K34DRAFT_251155 [Monoraphidium minutum]
MARPRPYGAGRCAPGPSPARGRALGAARTISPPWRAAAAARPPLVPACGAAGAAACARGPPLARSLPCRLPGSPASKSSDEKRARNTSPCRCRAVPWAAGCTLRTPPAACDCAATCQPHPLTPHREPPRCGRCSGRAERRANSTLCLLLHAHALTATPHRRAGGVTPASQTRGRRGRATPVCAACKTNTRRRRMGGGDEYLGRVLIGGQRTAGTTRARR